jgi:hypothetical protein
MLRFWWRATRGHRLTPWRSPYLLWRMETFSGMPADEIGFSEFWRFVWEHRRDLMRYLAWVERMDSHD